MPRSPSLRAALAAALALGLGGAAAAAVTPAPRPPAPQLYAPPQLAPEEDRTCLGVRVETDQVDAEILLRNNCALRINFALCVRRADEAGVQIATGSLSPAAVHGEIVRLGARSQAFTHRANFCSGVMCKVAPPEC